MTFEEWMERLRLMARSSVCHLEPAEAADLLRAIDTHTHVQSKRLTEAQREACAEFLAKTFADADDMVRDDVDPIEAVRATPLVQKVAP